MRNTNIVSKKINGRDKTWIYTIGVDFEKQFEYSGKLYESMDRAKQCLDGTILDGFKSTVSDIAYGAVMRCAKIPLDQMVSVEDLVSFCRVVFSTWTIIYRPEMSPYAVFDRINRQSFDEMFWRHYHSSSVENNIHDHGGDSDTIDFLIGVPHYNNKNKNILKRVRNPRFWEKTHSKSVYVENNKNNNLSHLRKLGEQMKLEDITLRKKYLDSHKMFSDGDAKSGVLSDEVASYCVRFIIGPRDILMRCNPIISKPTSEAIAIAWKWFWELLKLFTYRFRNVDITVRDVKGKKYGTNFMGYTSGESNTNI